jgi:hypothetical protein
MAHTVRTRPTSRRFVMGRDSITVCCRRSVSPGKTGLSHLMFSSPGEPWLEDSSRKLVTISRIAMEQVCQPLAHRPPNTDCFAASSSR